jgi:hypothetical protein
VLEFEELVEERVGGIVLIDISKELRTHVRDAILVKETLQCFLLKPYAGPLTAGARVSLCSEAKVKLAVRKAEFVTNQPVRSSVSHVVSKV